MSDAIAYLAAEMEIVDLKRAHAREVAALQSKLDAAEALLAKIGKAMNDPLLNQRERITIAGEVATHLLEIHRNQT